MPEKFTPNNNPAAQGDTDKNLTVILNLAK